MYIRLKKPLIVENYVESVKNLFKFNISENEFKQIRFYFLTNSVKTMFK